MKMAKVRRVRRRRRCLTNSPVGDARGATAQDAEDHGDTCDEEDDHGDDLDGGEPEFLSP